MLRWKRGVHMKMRTFLYRLVGAVIVLLGLALLFKFWYSKFFISVSTVIVIIGVAVFMMTSPESYNASTDVVKIRYGPSRIFTRHLKMYRRRWAAVIWDIFIR